MNELKQKSPAEQAKNRNKEGRFLPGVSGNPQGRPKGSEDFKTKWERAVERIAYANDVDPEDIEVILLEKAFTEARKGNFNFYKDIMDRLYGKPMQPPSSENDFKPIEEIHITVVNRHGNVRPENGRLEE